MQELYHIRAIQRSTRSQHENGPAQPKNLKAIRVVAVENAKEFSDVSDFILNINNELEDLPLGNYKIATTTEKRVQKVWSNKQKVIIIVNSSTLTYYLESVSSDNALFEFEDSSDLLQWLENCTDPWDTVESHWIRTAGTRLKLVKNTNAPASVYINKYPALKKPTGYILGKLGDSVHAGPGKEECVTFSSKILDAVNIATQNTLFQVTWAKVKGLEKAYDRVKRNDLWITLSMHGVSSGLI
ncbi:hypothetical protein EVAR_95431_1 [Eumeta japonica]|uniref:Uncharacterized protein n=1 Tax=Eumeta variegata TaxID=151549 RepID=A0A4C1VIW2_EUMVA|nr:hypothetical protein EVAR_95431_1 [Eumeta japonica]